MRESDYAKLVRRILQGDVIKAVRKDQYILTGHLAKDSEPKVLASHGLEDLAMALEQRVQRRWAKLMILSAGGHWSSLKARLLRRLHHKPQPDPQC